MQESTMRLRLMLAVAALAVVVGGGVAIAAHAPEIDPATVPTGFFVAHNRVADLPVEPIARAVKPDGADVFVQHLSLGANQVFAWHASWTGGRDRAQRVTDLPGRGSERLPRSRILGGPGVRRSRLRPRAPGDRRSVGSRDLLDVLPASGVGEPPDRGAAGGGVLVAGRHTNVSSSGSRESGSHCA